ncbi:hypothetical protein TRVL_05371 [Trypanosoma vivax]|nr:hypothetical protein TRVL_05371 [Trypanosoma vivax]
MARIQRIRRGGQVCVAMQRSWSRLGFCEFVGCYQEFAAAQRVERQWRGGASYEMHESTCGRKTRAGWQKASPFPRCVVKEGGRRMLGRRKEAASGGRAAGQNA